MTLEEGLFAQLTMDPDVSAIVGDRVYPLIMPQGSPLPAVTYQRISSARFYAHDGPSGLARPMIQLSCWAESYDEAKQVAALVRKALESASGTLGGQDGVPVQGIRVEDEVDLYEDNPPVFRTDLDTVFWYEEG
jgi:hypothetical protein